MIDILYITIPSKNYDLELMASLRTVYYHVKDWYRIFITGTCPEFINRKKVIFTPCENEPSSKMINHWIKVQRTIDETDIGENFVLMYDDIFFTKDVSLQDYPFYQKGKLCEDKNGGGEYQKSIKRTKKFLTKHYQPTNDYELHIPCVYNRYNFTKMRSIFEDEIKEKNPLAIRSVYGNLFHPNEPYKHDVKIRTVDDIINMEIMDQECISTTDGTFPYLAAPFIEPHIKIRSPWEK